MRIKLPTLAFMNMSGLFPIKFDYKYEYVSKIQSSTPFTRTSCRDRHIALRCTDDIHCPIGSRCYTSIEFPLASGVCVVTYDSQFLVTRLDQIWDT